MRLELQSQNLADYLAKTSIIDFDHPELIARAQRFRRLSDSDIDLTKRIYEYVRDEIAHSADIKGRGVTCKASEVLSAKEGVCYAKSHLLAALLRYNGIPCGFCYQLLRLDDDRSHLVLHGLNGVYLESLRRWIRLDARGNKPGVNAQFNLDDEKIAFPANDKLGEIDYPVIFAAPDQNVVDALTRCKTLDELWGNLPRQLVPTERIHTHETLVRKIFERH